jgi:hypothetical protein
VGEDHGHARVDAARRSAVRRQRMFWGGFNPLVGDEALNMLLAAAKREG